MLGGITLIAVKDDANIVAYRDKSRTLRDYINIHDIPAEISTSIESHLRLHFANEKVHRTTQPAPHRTAAPFPLFPSLIAIVH